MSEQKEKYKSPFLYQVETEEQSLKKDETKWAVCFSSCLTQVARVATAFSFEKISIFHQKQINQEMVNQLC